MAKDKVIKLPLSKLKSLLSDNSKKAKEQALAELLEQENNKPVEITAETSNEDILNILHGMDDEGDK